jgi:hypothetical protein
VLHFQVALLTVFMLPAQGFFNALVYFYSTKQPRPSSTVEQRTHSSALFAPPFRRWVRVLCSFSKRRSTASADPIASVASVTVQEEELQDLEKKDPVLEQIDRNETIAGSGISTNLVGIDLSTVPEANFE